MKDSGVTEVHGPRDWSETVPPYGQNSTLDGSEGAGAFHPEMKRWGFWVVSGFGIVSTLPAAFIHPDREPSKRGINAL